MIYKYQKLNSTLNRITQKYNIMIRQFEKFEVIKLYDEYYSLSDLIKWRSQKILNVSA